MKKFVVTLTQEERWRLRDICGAGEHRSQKVLNALILLNCDESEFQDHRCTNEEVAAVLRIGLRKIDHVKQRFVEEGLAVALNGQPRERQYERKVDGATEAHLVALSCGEPPVGRARWTLRLLADRAVELQYVEAVSYETVRRVLKKTSCSLGGRKGG